MGDAIEASVNHPLTLRGPIELSLTRLYGSLFVSLGIFKCRSEENRCSASECVMIAQQVLQNQSNLEVKHPKNLQDPRQLVLKATRVWGVVKKGKKGGDDMVAPLESTLAAELSCFKSSWKNFSLSELEEATDNFRKGGYAEVYEGQLKTGIYVAVKRLMNGPPDKMTIDFLFELGIIVHVDHPNIAKMIGNGVVGGMHLVLQLFQILAFQSGYLINGLIIPSPKLKAHLVTFLPKLFMHSIVDEKTDVYAFGVLLLELITGRQAVDSSHRSLVIWKIKSRSSSIQLLGMTMT
ncbi:hypothetical protein F3Y22_tig00000218pilonHSYRG00155 [Hibiscus syriacus]|uniref:Serine-threonine/tyrosine-protein kinase catalytic domain-containing protein n=1 Tax=Hibiscus syriacus TaxID=106335 RepID=A0A6A3D7U0_HIBSY|nr:hypothetical protein F3Y22_tig00000218pilonHSYRG00155 [Hibiscus syriacus]